MKTEISLDAAIGKTLEGYAFSLNNGQGVLVFADGTFTTIASWIKQSKLELHCFGDEEIVMAGIATAEEIEERRKAEREKRIAAFTAAEEARDKYQYEMLKKKFG